MLQSASTQRKDYFSAACTEVLLQILGYLEEDTRAITSLLTTSKLFYILARDVHYRRCRLSLNRSHDRSASAVEQLLRTLSNSPHLQYLIKSVSITYPAGGSEHPATIDKLLFKLPCIQEIELKQTPNPAQGKSVDHALQTTFLRQNPATQLRTVRVFDKTLQSDSIAQFITHGNVQTLSAWSFRDKAIPTNFGHMHSSSLTELNLGIFLVSPQVLTALLFLTPALKCLRLANSRWGDKARYDQIFELSSLVDCLKPVQNTLEELAISDVSDDWSGRGSSLTNFRHFRRLKNLSVPSPSFFGLLSFKSVGYSLSSVLPPLIESLAITFPPSSGIFYRSHTEQTTFESHSIQPILEYAWIEGLVAEKQHSTPALRTVRVVEQTKWDSERFCESIASGVTSTTSLGETWTHATHWRQPDSINRMYAAQKVDLEVRLRVHSKPLASGSPTTEWGLARFG